ncbi:hypothetical protein QUF80_23165 [Desulfococcaceae bacterium HSG8]|nr:hypothetical protein [Desulfococcaceae bacterium HSG8]
MQFVVPPSGGVMPPEGGTANFDLVCFFPEITLGKPGHCSPNKKSRPWSGTGFSISPY